MTAELKLDFSKCTAQTRAHLAIRPGARVCLPWGRGLGKSWFQRQQWWLQIAQWDGKVRPGAQLPGVRIVLLMPTLEQAKKVHGDLILAELEELWAPLGGRVNRTTWRISFPGGSWIQFVSSQRAHLVRGIRCDIVSIDEADDIDPDLVEAIVKPWFSEVHSLRILIVSGTPRRGRKGLLWRAHHDWPRLHLSAQDGEGRAHSDELRARLRLYKSFHATAYDAPLIVDPGYLEEIAVDTPEEIFKREWLCDFDASEGLVYTNFSERFHVRLPPPDVVWSDIFYAADHGFTDPGCILTLGVLGSGRDAQVWVLDEVYESQRESDWWEDRVKERIRPPKGYPYARWYPDSALPSVNTSWRKLGALVQMVHKGSGSIENGVEVVKRWLHIRTRMVRSEGGILIPEERASLYVHPRCKNLIDEFGLYRRKRDPKNPEASIEAIEDKNNHALDALRYGLTHHFPDLHGGRNAITHEQRQIAST